jgi:ribosomal protein S1
MHGAQQTSGYTHNLSISQINEWSDLGKIYKEELTKIFGTTLVDLRRSKSPSKIVLRATKKLEMLSFKYPSCKSFIEKSNRRLSIKIFYPLRSDIGLVFCSFHAEIAARSGQLIVNDEFPIQMTIHALQRLMERLNPHQESKILDEIYSCMDFCSNWNKAAKNVDAQTWPLISSNGFFVSSAGQHSGPAVLITYLLNVDLSVKWNNVIEALTLIKKTRPNLLNDVDYIEGFIRSFPWLEKEHTPDTLNLREELNSSADDIKERIKTSDNPFINESGLEKKSYDSIFSDRPNKASRNYKSGLNYKTEKPPFKIQTQHNGLVVRGKNSAELIVYLNNGWIGKITNYSRNAEKDFGVFQDLQPGDKVQVTVSRMMYFEDESAWLIHLDRTELVETRWVAVKKKYQIGYQYTGKILTGSNGKNIISIEKDLIGKIPIPQMLWLQENYLNCELNNLSDALISFELVDYDEIQKSLLLEIPTFRAMNAEIMQQQYPIGSKMLARFKSRHNAIIYLTLETGSIALLSARNCWDRSIENETSEIQIVILGWSSETSEVHVGLLPPPNVHKANYHLPFNNENWNHFIATSSIDDIIDVQVTSTLSDAYVCTLDNGLIGMIHFKNLDWFSDLRKIKNSVSLGDFISVRIIKLDLQKKRIYLDRKSIISNPLLDGRLQISIGTKLTGFIKTVVDYGYFVELSVGLDALLHKSVLMDGISLNQSDLVNVEITDINFDNGRIALKLISNY